MINFKDLLLIFTIYSFLGWMLETIFASIREGKFINRGFLTGSVCPIYGFSAIFIIQLSKWTASIFKNYFILIIINVLFSIILVTVLEYITGIFMEKIFDCKWWDYSDNAFNLHGYICIKYSLLWGLLAFLLIQIIHPVILAIVYSIPIYIKSYLKVFVLIYFLIDTSRSIIKYINLRKIILGDSNVWGNKYFEKIIQYKKLFNASSKLLIANMDIINYNIRSIINDEMDKIKDRFF